MFNNLEKNHKTTVNVITNNLQSAGVKVSQSTIHRRLRQRIVRVGGRLTVAIGGAADRTPAGPKFVTLVSGVGFKSIPPPSNSEPDQGCV